MCENLVHCLCQLSSSQGTQVCQRQCSEHQGSTATSTATVKFHSYTHALSKKRLKISKLRWFYAPKLYLGYEAHHSGGLRINLDLLGIVNLHRNLQIRPFSLFTHTLSKKNFPQVHSKAHTDLETSQKDDGCVSTFVRQGLHLFWRDVPIGYGLLNNRLQIVS